jgi:hypothetical protein
MRARQRFIPVGERPGRDQIFLIGPDLGQIVTNVLSFACTSCATSEPTAAPAKTYRSGLHVDAADVTGQNLAADR